MSVTIVYDSVFGNTATIARTMAGALEAKGPVRLVAIAEARGFAPEPGELLIVGSPTRGFQPTPAVSEFLAGLPVLTATARAAVFDTRLAPEDIHPAPLRWVVEAGGYAAQRMAEALRRKGYSIVADAGFLVGGHEGPLKDGEVERAAQWAAGLG